MVEVAGVSTPVAVVSCDQLPVGRGLSPLREVSNSLEGQSPLRLGVSAHQTQRLRPICLAGALVRHDPLDRMVRPGYQVGAIFFLSVLPLVEIRERLVRLEVVRVAVDQLLIRPARAVLVCDVPLGAPDDLQRRPLEPTRLDLLRQETQPAEGLGGLGAPHLLSQILGKHRHPIRVDLWQQRQHLEDRAVGILASERGDQHVGQRPQRRPGIVEVIGQIAFCEVVERDVVGGGRAADQDRALLPQRMSDAEFVEDVGVVDRHVADDKVRFENQAEHVLADVARLDDLAGRAAAEACGLQRGLDEGLADLLEVDFAACPIFLFSKWANDKCSLHKIPPTRLTSTRALRVDDLAGPALSRPAERLVAVGLDVGDPVHRLPERRLGADLATGEVE